MEHVCANIWVGKCYYYCYHTLLVSLSATYSANHECMKFGLLLLLLLMLARFFHLPQVVTVSRCLVKLSRCLGEYSIQAMQRLSTR
jgi:hypothetical protein